MSRTRAALVLTSGGLDSTTVLAIAQEEGFRPLPLTFEYGQTHGVEVDRARRVVAQLGLRPHIVLELPLGKVGGSALLGEGEIRDEPPGGAGSGEIPTTYVPARNLVFLALAVGVAEVHGARAIYIGANHLDYSGYPDCRPAFIEALERTANLATRAGVMSTAREPWLRIHAPLISLSKADIIRRGTDLNVDFALTVSCYRPDPEGLACGSCDSCGLRRRGFAEAGVPDPTRYRAE